MNANLSMTLKRLRQNRDTQIAVVPSSFAYLERMEACHQLAYGYTVDAQAFEVDPEAVTAEKFRSHIEIFPEGQFVAVDTRTDRVVGLTSSMRTNLNAHDAAKSWAELTNDG